MTATILVYLLDDDPVFSAILQAQLERRNYHCRTCQSWSALATLLDEQLPDIFIVDYFLGPASETGPELCIELRRRIDLPIVMLTGYDNSEALVHSLRAGAQHYVTKPYDINELDAHMHAALRDHRAGQSTHLTQAPHQALSHPADALQLNSVRGRLLLVSSEDYIELTDKELALMQLFMENDNQYLRRDEAFHQLYGREINPFNRIIDVLVSRLRKKLRLLGANIRIRTVRNEGYRLVDGRGTSESCTQSSGLESEASD